MGPKLSLLRPSKQLSRRPYDHRVIRDFNRSVILIAARIQELFQPEPSDPEKESFALGYASGFTALELSGVYLRRRWRLARWLLVNETCFVVSEQRGVYDYLSEDEQELLTRLRIRLCVPLIALNRLAGVIMLGPAQIELLRVLGNQAGLALENAALYPSSKIASGDSIGRNAWPPPTEPPASPTRSAIRRIPLR